MSVAERRRTSPEVVEFLTGVDETSHGFLYEMKRTQSRYGSLTERQEAAVEKFIAKRKEFAELPSEATEPVGEGRREITGTILSTKVKHGYYGASLKMLVKETDGNKVWGTVPESIEALTFRSDHYDEHGMFVEVDARVAELRGQEIVFTATVARSEDDEHFGFFKRPTGAKLTGLDRKEG